MSIIPTPPYRAISAEVPVQLGNIGGTVGTREWEPGVVAGSNTEWASGGVRSLGWGFSDF
jgi:hypothetical protein